MSKMIKTTNTDIKVDERYPWIDVYLTGGESKEFVTQIDEENMPTFVDYPEGYEELKRYCLNWFFKNVEIVKSIKKED